MIPKKYMLHVAKWENFTILKSPQKLKILKGPAMEKNQKNCKKFFLLKTFKNHLFCIKLTSFARFNLKKCKYFKISICQKGKIADFRSFEKLIKIMHSCHKNTMFGALIDARMKMLSNDTKITPLPGLTVKKSSNLLYLKKH